MKQSSMRKTGKPERKRRIEPDNETFNPPFSQNVQTNVAKSFLRLIDKHFETFPKITQTAQDLQKKQP